MNASINDSEPDAPWLPGCTMSGRCRRVIQSTERLFLLASAGCDDVASLPSDVAPAADDCVARSGVAADDCMASGDVADDCAASSGADAAGAERACRQRTTPA